MLVVLSGEPLQRTGSNLSVSGSGPRGRLHHWRGTSNMSRYGHSARRLSAAAALIVGIAACEAGGDRTVFIPPTTPTPSPPAAPPPAPSPPPPSSPQPVSTVTGGVFDYEAPGGPRPVPNLRLRVRTAGPGYGAVRGVELPDVVTDTNGRYAVAGVTSTLLFFSATPGSDTSILVRLLSAGGSSAVAARIF